MFSAPLQFHKYNKNHQNLCCRGNKRSPAHFSVQAQLTVNGQYSLWSAAKGCSGGQGDPASYDQIHQISLSDGQTESPQWGGASRISGDNGGANQPELEEEM